MQNNREPVSFHELEALNPDQQVWFARRCALRLFPFVGSNGSLGHWGEAGELYLEGIELSLLDLPADRDRRAAYASAAYSAAYANDEDAIAYAVTNVVAAFDQALMDLGAYAPAASYASATASLAIATAIDAQSEEMDNQRVDLDSLAAADGDPGPAPLWSGVRPANLSTVHQAFRDACVSVGRGDVYDRYRGLLYSLEPDAAVTHRRADEWLRRWQAFETSRS